MGFAAVVPSQSNFRSTKQQYCTLYGHCWNFEKSAQTFYRPIKNSKLFSMICTISNAHSTQAMEFGFSYNISEIFEFESVPRFTGHPVVFMKGYVS